jgi:pilus assembly protein Flp/PilA
VKTVKTITLSVAGRARQQRYQGRASTIFEDETDTTMKVLMTRFLLDEAAATAIEYGLIAACIAIAIIVAIQGVGTNLNSIFNNISANLR